MVSPSHAARDRLDGPRSQAFEEVYRAETTTLVRLGTLLLGSQAQAEEVVHDAFIKLHDNWDNVANPGGYVRTAVVNRCHDLLRRRILKRRHLQAAERELNELQRLSGQTDAIAERRYVQNLLARLSPRRRSVVVLKYFGGYTIKEIAEVLGLPLGTVQSNLNRALADLREISDD